MKFTRFLLCLPCQYCFSHRAEKTEASAPAPWLPSVRQISPEPVCSPMHPEHYPASESEYVNDVAYVADGTEAFWECDLSRNAASLSLQFEAYLSNGTLLNLYSSVSGADRGKIKSSKTVPFLPWSIEVSEVAGCKRIGLFGILIILDDGSERSFSNVGRKKLQGISEAIAQRKQ